MFYSSLVVANIMLIFLPAQLYAQASVPYGSSNCSDRNIRELTSILEAPSESTVMVVEKEKVIEVKVFDKDKYDRETNRRSQESPYVTVLDNRSPGGMRTIDISRPAEPYPDENDPRYQRTTLQFVREKSYEQNPDTSQRKQRQNQDRLSAIACLGQMQCDEVLGPITSVFNNMNNSSLLALIAQIIVKCGDDGIDTLWRSVWKGDRQHQEAALMVLAPVASADMTEDVIKLLSSPISDFAARGYLTQRPFEEIRETIVDLLQGRSCSDIGIGVSILSATSAWQKGSPASPDNQIIIDLLADIAENRQCLAEAYRARNLRNGLTTSAGQ